VMPIGYVKTAKSRQGCRAPAKEWLLTRGEREGECHGTDRLDATAEVLVKRPKAV